MPNTFEEKVTVSREYHGQRADVVLAQLFPQFSRSQLSLWLKEGRITLNNRLYKAKDKLHGNENIHIQVVFDKSPEPCRAENIPLDVIYEDEQVLVINKPAGLIVHPGAGNPTNTLVNALLYHDNNLAQLPRAGIVHRLDKETTGLLIVAKTLTAHTNLIRQMQAREIQRHYKTLVHGRMPKWQTSHHALQRQQALSDYDVVGRKINDWPHASNSRSYGSYQSSSSR